MFKKSFFSLTLMLAFSMSVFAQSEVVWKKNFGEGHSDNFTSVAEVSDGFVAVGTCRGGFGSGDWEGATGRGMQDAIIVKFNHTGAVQWRKNFGGSSFNHFEGVAAVPGGVVVVGYAESGSFGNGDFAAIPGKGNRDAVIVKYDNDGNVVWAKNFGGSRDEGFWAVTTVSDGFIAAGSAIISTGNGDWTGITGKSGQDAILVKFDFDGNVVWKRNYGGTGGSGYLHFSSVEGLSDGIIAAGSADNNVLNRGDFAGIPARGWEDAIIVKFNLSGDITWAKSFGGSWQDYFHSVSAVADGGFVAVGSSDVDSFNNGDWAGVDGNGRDDAFIVKYNKDGVLEWKKNFGGSDMDEFLSVTAVPDGVIAVGNSREGSFGGGDWTGVAGKGSRDAIIVKYANNGDVVWKKNFGGADGDNFNSVVAASDGFVAVGSISYGTLGTGDWADATGNGRAVIVKFGTSGGTDPDPDPDPDPTHIPFFNVVVMRWNNSLTVINNPANNGGYTFVEYQWYRNGQPDGGGQSWSAGDNGEVINPADRFYVALKTADNRSLRTTERTIPLIKSAQLKAYPNPVTIGQSLYFEMDRDTLRDAVIEIYTISGRPVERLNAASLSEIRIDAKYAAGTYILVVNGKNGVRFVVEN